MHASRSNEVGARNGPEFIEEGLFKATLARERRRSDRSDQPFVLVSIEPGPQLPGRAPLPFKEIIDALVATTRGTDIVGWLERRALLGLILCDIGASDPAKLCEAVEIRLRRELARSVETNTLDRLSIRFHLYPEPRRTAEREHWPADLILYPDLTARRKQAIQYDTIKRGLDITVSLGLLIALSPFLLLIAALVKSGSRGPTLFKQVRIGRMAKPFTMLKFRTMFQGSDEKVHQEYISSFIKGAGQATGTATNGVFKLTNDRRVTPIGHFLRKTSLDELPQLWNVLRGDMSLVGPRPPLPYELERYDAWHRCRVLEAKPGITGLWQVTGRSRTTFDEMVRLDLRYVRTRSLWTDIKILLATPAAVLSGKGAC